MAEYKLELKGVCKSFPGVKALDNVQLSLRPGTVHALMGENGAGKSTLMKCLFGIYRMDAGEVILDGKKIEINNPDEAMKYGIAMVHQELQPVPARSVAENLYLGRFPTKGFGPFKMIDHKTMYAETERWLKEVKMDFDPKAQLGSLSIGQMQSVEIAKAVSQQAKVVIFDEPTSSLSDNEVEALFRIMNDLRDKVILQRAQNVEIRKRLQQMQEPISFDIGLTPSATFSFALPRLCTYVNRNAEPRIQFHVSNTRRLLRGMQNGMLDAIIMEGEIPDMLVEATELCRENIIAAASPELSEELYGCTWSTLLKQPLIVLETGCGIRTLVQRHLSRSGISLYDFREVIEVDSFIVLKELLRQGLGIAFVLEPTIQQERDEKRLGRIYVDTMPMYGSLYFVTMRDRADNEQLWKIRDVLLQKTFSAGN